MPSAPVGAGAAFALEFGTDRTHLWDHCVVTVLCFKCCLIMLQFLLPDFSKEDCWCLEISAKHPGGKEGWEKPSTSTFSCPKSHPQLPGWRLRWAGSKGLSAEQIWTVWTQLKVSSPPQSSWGKPNTCGCFSSKVTAGRGWSHQLLLCWHYLFTTLASSTWILSQNIPGEMAAVEDKTTFTSMHPGFRIFGEMSPNLDWKIPGKKPSFPTLPMQICTQASLASKWYF